MARDVNTRYGLRKQDRRAYLLPELSSDEQEREAAETGVNQARTSKEREIVGDLKLVGPKLKRPPIGPAGDDSGPDVQETPIPRKRKLRRHHRIASDEADEYIPPLDLGDFVEDDGWGEADDEYRPSSTSTAKKPAARSSQRTVAKAPAQEPVGTTFENVGKKSSKPIILTNTRGSRPTWAVAPPQPTSAQDIPPSGPDPAPSTDPVHFARAITTAVPSNIKPLEVSIAKADFRKTIEEVLPNLKSTGNDRAVQLIESLSAVVKYDMKVRLQLENKILAQQQEQSDLQSRVQALEQHIKDKDEELQVQVSARAAETQSQAVAHTKLKQDLNDATKRIVLRNGSITILRKQCDDAQVKAKLAETRLVELEATAAEQARKLKEIIKEKEADLAFWEKE